MNNNQLKELFFNNDEEHENYDEEYEEYDEEDIERINKINERYEAIMNDMMELRNDIDGMDLIIHSEEALEDVMSIKRILDRMLDL